MLIINKKTANSSSINKDVHHYTARKELEKQYKSREFALQGNRAASLSVDNSSFRPLDSIQDVPMLRKEMKSYKQNFERGLPSDISPEMKDKLWIKAKQLKDKFSVGMVKKSELHPVSQRLINKGGSAVTAVVADYDKIKSTKAMERERAWHKKNDDDIREFKNIMRTLEPDNPDLPNVERFRPQ